ncbi:MAG: hypothetical protein NZ768_11070, partial [Pseudomonadales bacterium]|nr:hypothetical protein [Pseudomonadales bacterium]
PFPAPGAHAKEAEGYQGSRDNVVHSPHTVYIGHPLLRGSTHPHFLLFRIDLAHRLSYQRLCAFAANSKRLEY